MVFKRLLLETRTRKSLRLKNRIKNPRPAIDMHNEIGYSKDNRMHLSSLVLERKTLNYTKKT
jgi:hypothetical protein